MNPKLVNQIQPVHRHERPQRKTEIRDWQIKYPVRDAGKPALPDGDAQIILIRRMMNDVKIPEKANFVADAVKPVISEIVGKQQNRPRPPNVQRHFERRKFVNRKIKNARHQTEQTAPDDARKTDKNVIPGVFKVKICPIFTNDEISLQCDQKRENGNGDDGWR